MSVVEEIARDVEIIVENNYLLYLPLLPSFRPNKHRRVYTLIDETSSLDSIVEAMRRYSEEFI